MAIFKGCGVAMITAFTKNGINFNAQEKIIEHLITGGADAIFVCGTTGEPSTMTAGERESLIRFTVEKTRKRIPVFAGAGGNNTAESVTFAKKCADLGADGLLVVTPYYNKCTQNGLIEHYKAIAGAVRTPIIAYNVPTRTNINIQPQTALALSGIPNIVAIKEASGDIHQISEVIRLTKGKLDIYSGDDSLTVPAMSIGAIGVVSVAGNVIPSQMHQMTALCESGNFTDASAIHFRFAPLMQLLFCEVNPIPVKKAMQFLGFDTGVPRLPLTEMESQNAARLKAEMVRLGLLK